MCRAYYLTGFRDGGQWLRSAAGPPWLSCMNICRVYRGVVACHAAVCDAVPPCAVHADMHASLALGTV